MRVHQFHWAWAFIALAIATRVATAQELEPEPMPEAEATLPSFQLHGFISGGGFLSTANEYIGDSSRGSVEMFEIGLNVTTQVTDRLRAGAQLFARAVGEFRDLPPGLDWAYFDYRWIDELGLRAGIIKMPYGLYNEYNDIDSARTSILLPQSVYPLHNRTALLSHTGFSLYGDKRLGDRFGAIEYQAWFGSLNVPENALSVDGASLDEIDSKYVTGAQVFWRPPCTGLRVGASYLRTSVDFALTLDERNIAALIMLGIVPADFDGALRVSQRPASLWVASAELIRGDWLFAAEYSRWYKRQSTSLPMVLPTFEEDSERFYALAAHRFSELVEVGVYYSVFHVDANDRQGRNAMKFPVRPFAFQRDAAATLRIDINEHWTWKVEAHFIDGTADLRVPRNPTVERYWGLFLFKTTVTF